MSDDLTNYEYERRFLVAETSILDQATSSYIRQAYLWSRGGYAVRIRIRQQARDDMTDAVAFLGLKGPRESTARYELEIPLDDLDHAVRVYEMEANRVEKTRYSLSSEGELWEIDVFHGDNQGLIVAEFEASAVSVSRQKAPWWAGHEVTDDSRYNNEELAKHPWKRWGEYA